MFNPAYKIECKIESSKTFLNMYTEGYNPGFHMGMFWGLGISGISYAVSVFGDWSNFGVRFGLSLLFGVALLIIRKAERAKLKIIIEKCEESIINSGDLK